MPKLWIRRCGCGMYEVSVQLFYLSIFFIYPFNIFRCLQDGNNGWFRLCIECDRVFHKAATKKSHIRIPLHPHDARCSSSTENRHFHDMNELMTDYCIDSFTTLESIDPASQSVSGTVTGSGIALILIASGLRGVIDDRRVRQYILNVFYFWLIYILFSSKKGTGTTCPLGAFRSSPFDIKENYYQWEFRLIHP